MRTAATMMLGFVLTAIVAAADIWDKPFAEWSVKDAEKVMTDSPWAGKASITHNRIGTNLGTVPDWDLIVSVRSARPYQQAVLRQQIGTAGIPTPEQTARLAEGNAHYVVVISGIPRAFFAQAAAIAKAATLKRAHKEPLKVRDASVLLFDRNGNQVAPEPPPARGAGGAPPGAGGFGGFGEDKSGITATLFLGFPKDDPITADEGDVELSTVISFYNVSRKFKPKDMTVNGVLAF